MALTAVNIVNLPEGTTLKVGNIEKVADAAGAVLLELTEGQHAAELEYGGQVYSITLNVGKSTADRIQEATVGLKTQAELDAAVAAATAGLKTQADLDTAVATAVALATANTVPQADLDTVNAQLAQETANAVEIGKGYIDATALAIVETANQFGAKSYTVSIKYSVDKVKTPLVAKVRETFYTGDTQDILIADAVDNREVIVYRNDGANAPTVTKIEVIAGNNKVIDTYDLAFTNTITMLPDPVATVTPSMEEVTIATTNTVQVKTRNVPNGTLYLYDVNKSTYVSSDPIVSNTVTFNGTFVAGAKHFISDKNTAQVASQDYIGKFTLPPADAPVPTQGWVSLYSVESGNVRLVFSNDISKIEVINNNANINTYDKNILAIVTYRGEDKPFYLTDLTTERQINIYNTSNKLVEVFNLVNP